MSWRGRATGLLTLLLFSSVVAAAAQEPARNGRSLADALRALQVEGLRIVFTSATVSPELRVVVQPDGATPRKQLDQLLEPHGLKAVEGPGGVLLVIRVKAPPDPPSDPPAAAPRGNSRPAITAHERVTVTGSKPYRDHGVPSETILDQRQLDRFHASLADDPARAVHVLPRVSAVDDFRSEFTIRGSPFRHVDVVVDGVPTRWLQHTAYRRQAAGSLGMLATPLLEEISVRAGAYPRRDGNRLGPQLDLRVREGSRERVAVRGGVGGTSAMLLGEGPVGRSERGSWLVALRQSYLEWPVGHEDSDRAPFGFSDALAKIVYDVSPRQRVGLSAIVGTSLVDGDDNPLPTEPGDGRNRATAVNLSWRSTLGSAAVLTQRAYLVRQDFANDDATGASDNRGSNEQLAYRGDVVYPVPRGLLEAGAHVVRSTVRQAGRDSAGELLGSAWLRAGYVHLAFSPARGLTVSPGLRVDASTVLSQRAVSKWILGEWVFRTRWSLAASAGVSYQLTELSNALSAPETTLRPERATHVDVALERRVGDAVRWQATVFSRDEADILREPDLYPRLVSGEIAPAAPGRFASALRGSSRGLELLVERRSAAGLSAWMAYSYGHARQTDTERDQTFWADYDRRHALTVSGTYRFGARVGVGATFLAGTNFPIPAYLEARAGRLFVGARRNEIRLPSYARLDLRGDYGLTVLNRRVTMFAEVLNVLGRTNVGVGDATIDPKTGEATGLTSPLLGRHASGGFTIQF